MFPLPRWTLTTSELTGLRGRGGLFASSVPHDMARAALLPAFRSRSEQRLSDVLLIGQRHFGVREFIPAFLSFSFVDIEQNRHPLRSSESPVENEASFRRLNSGRSEDLGRQ